MLPRLLTPLILLFSYSAIASNHIIDLETLITNPDKNKGLIIQGAYEYDSIGHVLAYLGDMNGDGVAELGFGSQATTAGVELDSVFTGGVYVLYSNGHDFEEKYSYYYDLNDIRSSTGFNSDGFLLYSAMQFDDNTPDDLIGYSLEKAGDFNNDGLADLVITSYAIRQFPDSDTTYSTLTFIYYGFDTSNCAEPDSCPQAIFNLSGLDTIYGGATERGFLNYGYNFLGEASTVGDINNDSIDDLFHGSLSEYGSVLWGKSVGPSANVSNWGLSEINGGDGAEGIHIKLGGDDGYASNSSKVGDINGDGIDDFAITTDARAVSNNDEDIRTYVIFGGNKPFPANLDLIDSESSENQISADIVIKGGKYIDPFIYGLGDIDGDGLSDFAQPGVDQENNLGIYIFHSQRLGENRVITDLINSNTVSFIKGIDTYETPFDVSSGDFNNDGVNDIVIGCPRCEFDGSRIGLAYLLWGRDSLSEGFDLHELEEQSIDKSSKGLLFKGVGALSANSVALDGDVNNDGYSDLAISAPLVSFEESRPESGAIFIYYGTKLFNNNVPTANDDSITTEYETAVNIGILSNDSDPDGSLDLTSISIVASVTNGNLEVLSSGEVQYTPNTGFNGEDSFTYTVKDNDGATSNEAMVTITVKAQSTPTPTPTPPPSSGGGGGGSTSLLFMFMMLAYAGRRYCR